MSDSDTSIDPVPTPAVEGRPSPAVALREGEAFTRGEPEVVVLHGQVAEDPDAYRAAVEALVRHYGARGPVELELVDRICSLQWRLRRLRRAERGRLAAATIGLGWRRITGEIESAGKEVRRRRLDDRGVLGSGNPQVVGMGADALRRLKAKVADGQATDTDVVAALLLVFGMDAITRMPMGEGGVIVDTWWMRNCAVDDAAAEDAGEEMAGIVQVLEAQVLARLDGAIATVDGARDALLREAGAVATAKGEAEGLPHGETVKAMVAYERHLERGLADATRALERTVARRRLAAVARRVGVDGLL